MALSVNWRWSMPQVGSPNAQSDDMAQGLNTLTQGIGRMIGGIRKENREDEQRRQAQENWERTFDQNKLQNTLQQQNWARQFAQNQMQAARQQENWQKQYEMQKALQDYNMSRQKNQDEWLQKFYDQYFGDDEEYEELKRLRALFGNEGVSELDLIMAGLNPSLR